MRYPTSRIVFNLGTPGQTRIVISDANEQTVRTLIDALLPAGQYRLHWDFTDNERQTLAADQTYNYEIRLDGDLHRKANLESPPPIWQ